MAVPADWFASIQPDCLNEGYLASARLQILATQEGRDKELNAQAARLWGPEGLGKKITIIRESLLPSQKSLASMYPAAANSWRIYLFYPVRIKDMLVRHGATLWRMARGDPITQAATECTNQFSALLEWLKSD